MADSSLSFHKTEKEAVPMCVHRSNTLVIFRKSDHFGPFRRFLNIIIDMWKKAQQ